MSSFVPDGYCTYFAKFDHFGRYLFADKWTGRERLARPTREAEIANFSDSAAGRSAAALLSWCSDPEMYNDDDAYKRANITREKLRQLLYSGSSDAYEFAKENLVKIPTTRWADDKYWYELDRSGTGVLFKIDTPCEQAAIEKRRGPKTRILEQVKANMREALRNGEYTPLILRSTLEKTLQIDFGASRDTCRKARLEILSESEFVEGNSDK